MDTAWPIRGIVWLVAYNTLAAHAPPTPIASPPLRVRSNILVDSTDTPVVLRGVVLPGLESGAPPPAAMTPFTFQIIQQRWNMNAVRLPVSAALWKRDPQNYLAQAAAAVSAANTQQLVAILSAYPADDAGLPTSDVLDFWRAAASTFRDTPGVIFSLYQEPSTRNIPGSTPGAHRPGDWSVWLQGGALVGGRTAIGMQALVDAIRAAGAAQVIAAPSFHDALGFQGFTAGASIRDSNILYEIHPFFDQGLTDDDRDRNFGFMLANFPVLAGAWGAAFGTGDPSCLALGTDTINATTVLLQTTAYFDRRGVSWTVSDFAPGGLIRTFDGYAATSTGQVWNCAAGDGRTGIGQFILLWMTGDPNGFGSLDPEQIASAAGGPPGPIAPGQLLALYGQSIGPELPLGPLVAEGRVATSLGGVQVLFDGVPAPIVLSGYFQVNVQVPYEVASHATTTIQLIHRGVPSNTVQLTVASSAPGVFTNIIGGSDARILNQDGTINDPGNAATRGSVVSVFCTGGGQTVPASLTGVVAALPLPVPAIPMTVLIGDRPAEVLYGGPAPGLLGVTQVNTRIPPDVALASPPERASIAVTVGNSTSRGGVVIWVK